MTVKRLLTVVFAIVSATVALGIVSLSAQLQAATAMAGERVVRADSEDPVDPGAYLVADVVGNGDEMLLFPQTGAVIRCSRGQIRQMDGPCVFENGRIYTWVNGRKHRVWLFGVVSEKAPNVRVDG